MATAAPVTSPSVEVWVADLDLLDASAATLSGPERERAGRFVFPVDRDRYCAGRRLLRQVLGERLGEAAPAVGLAEGPFGKPFLAGRAGPCFNLSHSGPLAVLALASMPVGIDVERIDRELDWPPLARRFFAPTEWQTLCALSAEDGVEGFFACWTRKEALVKATGLGLSQPLHTFAVSVDPTAPPTLLWGAPPFTPSSWWLTELPMPAGYRSCLATADPATVVVRTL